MTGQFTTAKTSGCANVLLNRSRAEKVYSWYGGHPGLTVWNLLKYTQELKIHIKYAKKTLFFIMWLLYVQLYIWETEQIQASVSHYDYSTWSAN